MRILRTVADLRAWRAAQSTLGFVPTMGSLHEGHLNLLRSSIKDQQSTLLSVFVNPSQFSPTEDLDTYPRTLQDDVAKFEKLCDTQNADSVAVFAPSVSEMYPNGIELDVHKQTGTFVEVLGSSHQLEGAIRPHFFRGVATVVTKLLNAAQADVAYFGQKDIQQTVVVRSLVRDLLIPTKIEVKPTEREANGLAMSSRNAYLSSSEREQAGIIFRTLTEAKNSAIADKQLRSAEIVSQITEKLSASSLIKAVEYASVNDLNTFADLGVPKPGTSVISTAVRLHNGLRLIDNVLV